MKQTPLKPGKPLERGANGLTVDPEKVRAWQDRSRRQAVERHRVRPLPPEPKPRKRPPVHTPSSVVKLIKARSVLAVGLDPGDYPAGLCELCGALATNTHTRRPNGMGGTKRPESLLASAKIRVCGQGNVTGCHGRLEGSRVWALGRGVLLHQSQDPAAEPIRLRYGLVLLDDEGGWTAMEAAA